LLLQRIEDEFVRRALDNGCDRDAVMDVLDLSRRGTFYKEKRARAYDFPLDAVDRRGGRPPADETVDESGDAATASDEPTAGDGQQRLDAVADGAGEVTGDSDVGHEERQPSDGDGGLGSDNPGAERPQVDPHECVREAIAALQALDAVL